MKTGLHPLVWLYLIAVVIPVGFDLGSVAMTGLRLLLLFTIVPMSISLFSGKYGKVYPVDYLFFLHIVWMSFALIANNPAGALQNVGSTAIEFLGGYVLARGLIRTPEAFAALIRAILLLVVLSLPLAVVEARTGTAVLPALIEKVPGLTSVVQVTIEKRLGLHRVQGYFSHPIHYGLFCSVAMSLIFVGMRNIMSLGKRVAGGMVITLGVFLSLSSGALLALLLQFALITWNYMLRNVKRRWLLLLGLFVLAYVVVDLLSNRTPIRVLMSYATFSAHTAYYRSIIFEWGLINVMNNPLLGLGFRDWIRPSFMHSGTVDNFWLVMAMFVAYLVFKRLWPRYVILMVLAIGTAIAAATGALHLDAVQLSVSTPVWVTPAFNWQTLIGVGLPLFIVTMASQNIPGVAVMRAAGYHPPISPLITTTGIATLVLAPFGGFAINLAAITAAICMGPEADEDPAKRYVAAIFSGGFAVLLGVFGATIGALFAAFPRELVFAVAGLALLGTIGNALSIAVKADDTREAALVTFLATASGMSLFGIGSAFWGLVLGGLALAVLRKPAAKA